MRHDVPYGHRRSVRLPGYDYAQPGVYFVTICTENRVKLFGEVRDDAVELNGFGTEVARCWQWLRDRHPYLDLDQYVVMPNHLHGLVVFRDRDLAAQTGQKGIAPTAERPSTVPFAKGDEVRKPLGRLIGAFKTVSARRIAALPGVRSGTVWQRGYYEHVVRNVEELDRTRQYIITNPAQWAFDRENPERTGRSRQAPF